MVNTKKRKNATPSVEASILIKCARRCALCFGLKRDVRSKNGQLAHIDKNSANNKESNFVYLCMWHHDKYDGKTRQSKGITIQEVKIYQRRLNYFVENWDFPKLARKQVAGGKMADADSSFASVREQRIDDLHRAMREGAIWIQRLTDPSAPKILPRSLLTSFAEAYSKFQRARTDAILYVSAETSELLEKMAHALSKAHLYRTQEDIEGWIKSDEFFEEYVKLLRDSENQLRILLNAITLQPFA